MKKLILSLSIILLFSLKPKAQSLQFKNFSVEDGLLSSTVYDVFQDSKGFIWLATTNGVNRYDGKTFENFTTENGLSDIEILKIKEDQEGRIWFLSFNGKLSYFQDGEIFNIKNSKTLAEATSHSNFVDFFEDYKHNLWFSTNIGEVICITNSQQVKRFTNSEIKTSISSLIFFEDDYKRLWAVNKNHLYRIDKYSFQLVNLINKPISSKYIQYDRPSNTLFIINRNGLFSLQNGKEKFVGKIPSDAVEKGISSFLIESNTIWLTILGNGIEKINFETGIQTDYLSNKYVSSIIKDVRQNIWISTLDNGLYLLSKQATNFTHFTEKDLLSNEGVYSITKDNSGKIWLGLRNGQIDILNNGKLTVLDLNLEPLLYNPIKKLWFDKAHNVIWFMCDSWIGYLDADNPKIPKIPFKQDFLFALKSFDFNNRQELAVAMAGGVYLFKPEIKPKENTAINVDNFKKIIPARTFSVAYDSHNHLWFSQLDGIHVIKNNKIFSFSSSIEAVKDRVVNIFCGDQGLTYASTSSHGICILKDQKLLKVISTKDGLNSNNCLKSVAYGNELWVLNSNGVNRIINPLGDMKITGYTIDNGLLSNEVNDILVDSNFIYLATNKGLTRLNREDENDYKPDLPLYFKKFMVGKKEYKITDKIIELPANKNNIQISYTAINFENPDGIIYAYRIKKSDNWTETANNSLEFASLEPGYYNIQIRAKDLYGNWGKSIELSIQVDTPFYDTFWFLILIISTIITISLIIYNRYLKRRQAIEDEKILNESKIIALEQQALQAMMNPHFIFNVMNSIQYFINTQDKTTSNKLLTGFARLIRKNLDIVNKGEISLAEEVDYLRLYLELESLRYGQKLSYDFIIDEDIELEDIMIPSMLLQPFVENSIWHGIMPKDEKGTILISIHESHQLLRITIEDDGIGIENSFKAKNDEYVSRGMTITQERINLINQLAGTEINIQINQRPEGGTIVRINIPLFNP